MAKKLSDRSGVTQLAVFLVAKVGWRDARNVCVFIAQWGTVSRKLKREPTWAEYCAYWHESRATYHRGLKLFRTVWPDDKNPTRVWNWVESQIPASASVQRAADLVGLAVMA
jgi:hypothetical protein